MKRYYQKGEHLVGSAYAPVSGYYRIINGPKNPHRWWHFPWVCQWSVQEEGLLLLGRYCNYCDVRWIDKEIRR